MIVSPKMATLTVSKDFYFLLALEPFYSYSKIMISFIIQHLSCSPSCISTNERKKLFQRYTYFSILKVILRI